MPCYHTKALEYELPSLKIAQHNHPDKTGVKQAKASSTL